MARNSHLSIHSQSDEQPLRYEDNLEFNESIDAECGVVSIGQLAFSPSEILFRLELRSYKALLTEFMQQRDEDLKETVARDFPLPIAHAFHRYEHGSENHIQQLHHLRDVWESLVTLLLAIVIGECCCRGIPLAQASVKSRDIRSDRLSDRLRVIESILRWTLENGHSLTCHEIVPLEVVEQMRELNQTRNGFSHSQAISEQQAKSIVRDTKDEVLAVLRQVERLSDVSLFRYVGHEDNDLLAVRVETFSGHALSRTIKTWPLAKEELVNSASVLNGNRIGARMGGRMFSLAPFVCPQQDESGHRTRVCLFKKRSGDTPSQRIHCEIVGESTPTEFDAKDFDVEFASIGTAISDKGASSDAVSA